MHFQFLRQQVNLLFKPTQAVLEAHHFHLGSLRGAARECNWYSLRGLDRDSLDPRRLNNTSWLVMRCHVRHKAWLSHVSRLGNEGPNRHKAWRQSSRGSSQAPTNS